MIRRRNDPAFRAALAGMFAMAAAMGIGRFVYTPILPFMMGAGALDPSEAGLVAGFNYLGYLLGALAASLGLFARHRRIWLFLALAASVTTTAAMALAGGLEAMMAVRFLSGVASAFSMIFVTTIVMARLASLNAPHLIAFHFGGVGVGIAGSAVMVSILAAGGTNWPGIWLASGLASAAAFVAVMWLLPETEPEVRPPKRRRGERSVGAASLGVFIASYGLFGFGYVITATFINAMAKSEPALAPVEPYVWIVLGLAGTPSVWLWNRTTLRFGVTGTYALTCLVEAAGVALGVTFLSPFVLLVSAALVGGTFIAGTSLGLARAREMSPANPATAIALMTASFGLGQMIGPVVAGWLFEWAGDLFLASWLAAAALVMTAILALMAERMARRDAILAASGG